MYYASGLSDIADYIFTTMHSIIKLKF